MKIFLKSVVWALLFLMQSCAGWVVSPPSGSVSVSVGSPAYSPTYIPSYLPPVIPAYSPGPMLSPPMHIPRIHRIPMGVPFQGGMPHRNGTSIPQLEPGPVMPRR